MPDGTFRRYVALLAALRIAPALVVLAAHGRSLPLLPGYRYGPPNGDTYGFYAAAREFISAWAHVPRPLLGLGCVAVVVAAVVVVGAWRRGHRTAAVTLAAIVTGAFTCLAIREMGTTGAGAVGWPMTWALPLFPLRALNTLSYHVAFYVGVVILLACNAVTVVATAVISRRLIPGRLALLPPALLVVWPFAMRIVEGTGNGVYGSWLTDAGLLLYSEPLSTALATTALALVLLRGQAPHAAALAGALMGYATAVRVSNATIAVVLFAALLLARTWKSATAFALAGIGVVSIAAVFWSRGYSSFHNQPSKLAPNGLFSWHYAVRSWRDSTVFDWKMLLILLPLPVLGCIALRRVRDLVLLAGCVLATAIFYSLYYITALHPRFLYVALPPLFVLAALGVEQLRAAMAGRPVRSP